jgi:hypothetical protein
MGPPIHVGLIGLAYRAGIERADLDGVLKDPAKNTQRAVVVAFSGRDCAHLKNQY